MIRRDTAKLSIVIGLIAAPPAIIGAFVDYPYCIAGAFLFATVAFVAARAWPARSVLCIALSAIFGLACTIALDLFSRHEIIIANQTSQRITNIDLSCGHHLFIIPSLPAACVARIKFHDLMFDGIVDDVEGAFADGGRIEMERKAIRDDQYRWALHVIVEGGGKVRLVRD